MAMGVIQSAIGLFGNVPCPIIYGAVVDSACLMWKTICGKNGACSLYDPDTFRQYYLGKFYSICLIINIKISQSSIIFEFLSFFFFVRYYRFYNVFGIYYGHSSLV